MDRHIRGTGLMVLLLAAGCGQTPPPPAAEAQPAAAVTTAAPPAAEAAPAAPLLPGDEEVVARVDGNPITRYDLDQAIAYTQVPATDAAVRRKVLESLVMARVIARAAEPALTDEQRARFDRMARDYREQLVVKEYLRTHVEPQSVTQEMVEQYWRDHPERFGGATLRGYELLVATRAPDGEERARLLAALGNAAGRPDWQGYAAELVAAGLPVAWRKGQATDELLDPRLRGVVEQLGAGQTSDTVLVQGLAQVVRVTEARAVAPRPLSEVSSEIRRLLLPMQLKKAVEQVTAALLQGARVEYAGEPSSAAENQPPQPK